MSIRPPPYPTSFDPKAWSTHPLLGQSLGYPAYWPRRQAPYIFGHRTGLEPGCARRQAKTQWPRFNEIRQMYIPLISHVWVKLNAHAHLFSRMSSTVNWGMMEKQKKTSSEKIKNKKQHSIIYWNNKGILDLNRYQHICVKWITALQQL